MYHLSNSHHSKYHVFLWGILPLLRVYIPMHSFSSLVPPFHGEIFVVKLQSPESPHQLSSCFIDALEEELLTGIYIFTLHVCVQIQHDSNIYHQERSFLGTRFHAWWTISGSEKNLLSWRSCQILGIFDTCLSSINFSSLSFLSVGKCSNESNLNEYLTTTDDWFSDMGPVQTISTCQESVHDFWENFTKLKTMTGEDCPTPRNHLHEGRQFSFQLFDLLQDACQAHGTHVKNVILVNHFSSSHLLKVVVQPTWSYANSHSIPKNQGHSKIPKVYKVMLVKTQLLHFALVRISCRTRCLKQRRWQWHFSNEKRVKIEKSLCCEFDQIWQLGFLWTIPWNTGVFPG